MPSFNIFAHPTFLVYVLKYSTGHIKKSGGVYTSPSSCVSSLSFLFLHIHPYIYIIVHLLNLHVYIHLYIVSLMHHLIYFISLLISSSTCAPIQTSILKNNINTYSQLQQRKEFNFFTAIARREQMLSIGQQTALFNQL